MRLTRARLTVSSDFWTLQSAQNDCPSDAMTMASFCLHLCFIRVNTVIFFLLFVRNSAVSVPVFVHVMYFRCACYVFPFTTGIRLWRFSSPQLVQNGQFKLVFFAYLRC